MPFEKASPFHSFLSFLQFHYDLFLILLVRALPDIPQRLVSVDNACCLMGKIGWITFDAHTE